LLKARSGASDLAEAGAGNGFKLEEFLPYQLAVTANRVSRIFAKRFADDFGLSIPEWRVLAVVGRFESASPSMVSDKASMDKVKVSRAVGTLVARGLLKQTQDPEDGRARVLRLTKKGLNAYQSLVPLARELEAQLSEGLSRQDWSALRKSLERLTAHVESLEGGEGEDLE
jgi:DNA-binding MarR family transcriptional regulator